MMAFLKSMQRAEQSKALHDTHEQNICIGTKGLYLHGGDGGGDLLQNTVCVCVGVCVSVRLFDTSLDFPFTSQIVHLSAPNTKGGEYIEMKCKECMCCCVKLVSKMKGGFYARRRVYVY